MRTTTIRWRRAGAPHTARCMGLSFDDQCDDLATWCREWQSTAMSAPAFWYFCAPHAEDVSRRDGIRLEG